MAGRHEAVFAYHPLVLAATLLSSLLTVLISAWLPARKLSRLTPLEAIKNTGELQLKRKKKSRVLALLFGIEGELAGNALKAQRKALRTAALSLTLSFLGFTLMLSFFTLSGISTNHTYFERYQGRLGCDGSACGHEAYGLFLYGGNPCSGGYRQRDLSKGRRPLLCSRGRCQRRGKKSGRPGSHRRKRRRRGGRGLYGAGSHCDSGRPQLCPVL